MSKFSSLGAIGAALDRPSAPARGSELPDEAWIEEISWRGELAHLVLLRADGRSLRRSLGSHQAEWLDLRPGQIVTLPLGSAR